MMSPSVTLVLWCGTITSLTNSLIDLLTLLTQSDSVPHRRFDHSLTHSLIHNHSPIAVFNPVCVHCFIQTHISKNSHEEISWCEPLHSLRPVRQTNKGLPHVSMILRSFQRLSRSISLLRAVDHPASVTLCLSSPWQVSSNRLSFSAHWFQRINSGHAWPAERQSTQRRPGL